MNKKSFFSGIILGVIVCACALYTFDALASNRVLRMTDKINIIMDTLDEQFVYDVDRAVLEESMYRGLVAGVDDPYTSYMSPKETEDLAESSRGSYAGIGVLLTMDKEDGSIVIVQVFPNTPADKAKLQPNDKILLIDGEGYAEYESGVDRLRGKSGSKVEITIYRAETDKTFNVAIVRQVIDIPSVAHEMVDDTTGLIAVSHFDMAMPKQFYSAYDALIESGMKQLIIDLRSNPGGTLDSAVEIADFFVAADYIIYMEDKYGNREYSYADKKSVGIPLVVLVNEHTASASEIFAAAVQDTGAGVIIGERTFGKGIVQRPYQLADGSGLIVTTAKYYTPAGICIHGLGIEPDIEVDPKDYEALIAAALEVFD